MLLVFDLSDMEGSRQRELSPADVSVLLRTNAKVIRYLSAFQNLTPQQKSNLAAPFFLLGVLLL